MRIKINGQVQELPGDMATLRAVLEYLGIDDTQTGIAVAVNLSVVPRSAWAQHMVQEDDAVEVITARQGG